MMYWLKDNKRQVINNKQQVSSTSKTKGLQGYDKIYTLQHTHARSARHLCPGGHRRGGEPEAGRLHGIHVRGTGLRLQLQDASLA